MCAGSLSIRWVGVTTHSRRGYRARAYPVHVCGGCGLSVQVSRTRARGSHASRRAACASQARRLKALEKRYRVLVAR